MNPLITPRLDLKPEDERGFFVLAWYKFWESITTLTSYLLVTVTDLLSRDFVYGGANLTNVGAIPKVSAAGTVSESAITDDAASILIVGRHVVLTNGKIIKQYAADGVTLRNLITHFSDDVVYLDNADGDVSIRPKAGSLLRSSTGADLAGDVTVSGVFKVGVNQVVGARLAAVTSPSGGGTVVAAPAGGGVIDVQARTAIGLIIAAISGAGNTVDPAARTAIDAIRDRLKVTTGHGLTS